MEMFHKWNNMALTNDIQNNKKNEKLILFEWIKKNGKKRLNDVEPISHYFNKYYKNYIVEKKIKICDYTLKYNYFKNLKNIYMRDEIKFKLVLSSLFDLNKKFFEDIKVKIRYEFEGISEYYKNSVISLCSFLCEIYKTCDKNYNKKMNLNDGKYRYHDCLIKIYTDCNETMEIACEFNEKSHTREYDNYRKKSMKLPLIKIEPCQKYDEETINIYIKKLIDDIILESAHLNADKTLYAKYLLSNRSKILYDDISLLINCIDANKFIFDDIINLCKIPVRNQNKLKDFLLENNILKQKNKGKIYYSKDEDDNYFLDKNNFYDFLLIGYKRKINTNFYDLLKIYNNGTQALIDASDKINYIINENRIKLENVIIFIEEILEKPIKKLLNMILKIKA